MLIIGHNQRGFSLIELIVGVMIISILAAVGIPSFASWIQNAQLRTAAETITNGLQFARAEAVRRNTNVQFSLTGTTNVDSSWSVGCVIPVGDLNADGVDDCPAIIQSRNGSEGSRNAVVNADTATIVFTALGRNTSNGDNTINVTNPTGGLCMAAAGSMRCLNIIVTTGGGVRMCNPALPSRLINPQGC